MKMAYAVGLSLMATNVFSAGSSYFVDAVNGNNEWDGSRSFEDRDMSTTPPKGPKQWLSAAAELMAQGDILYVAPGHYTNGVMESATLLKRGDYPNTKWRVILPSESKMIASGRKDETFLHGAPAEDADPTKEDNGCGNTAMRIVAAPSGLVKGFTLLGGRSQSSTVGTACCAGGFYGGYLVDCVVSNCTAGQGAALYTGTAIGCFLKGNVTASLQNGPDAYNSDLFNCYIGSGVAGGKTVNCSSDTRIGQGVTCYNCYASDSGYAGTFYRSKFQTARTGTYEDGASAATAAELNLDSSIRPKSGSVLIGAANESYYEEYYPDSELVAEFKNVDFFGRPRKLLGSMDIGYAEGPTSVTVVDANGGLVLDGVSVGTTDVIEGELSFSIGRNLGVKPVCTGFMANGEFVSFDGHAPEWKWTKTIASTNEPLTITATYKDKIEWYVDAINGDDGNCGLVAGTNYARKTLMSVMSLASSGQTIHAARGVYDFGGGAAAGSNRVVIAKGVTLVADEGADVTFIEGKEAAAGGRGVDSMRAVYMNQGSVLKGFTVRNGYTSTDTSGNAASGGGVYSNGAAGNALCVECVIEGCLAPRGSAASGVTLLRCRVGQQASGDVNGAYLNVSMVDCVYASSGNAYSFVTAYNTIFLESGLVGGASAHCKAYNCAFYNQSGSSYCDFSNCVSVTAQTATITDLGGSTFGIDVADYGYEPVTFRPVAGSKLIDRGIVCYDLATNGWSAAWQEYLVCDYAGGQRIYNGTIDIGSGEYDWRGDFARCLTRKTDQLAVAIATPNVVTNASGALTLNGGDRIELALNVKIEGDVSFTLEPTGDGTATVLVDGGPLVPQSGKYVLAKVVGEHTVEIAFEGAGSVAVRNFKLPSLGLLIMFR